jgi:hypothetical protein
MMLWAEYLLEVGAMTEAERIAYIDHARQVVTAVAIAHAAVLTGGGAAHELILDAIRSGALAQRIRIGSSDPDSRVQRIGTTRDVDGEPCILLFADEVLRFLKTDERWRSMNNIQLARELTPALLGDRTGTQKLSIENQKVPVFVIPRSVWAMPDADQNHD